MAGYRSFGPAVSDGIPIRAGQRLSLRVTHGDSGARTLERVRFGIHQLEPRGQAGVADISPWPPFNPDTERILVQQGASTLKCFSGTGTLLWNVASDVRGGARGTVISADGRGFVAQGDGIYQVTDWSNGTMTKWVSWPGEAAVTVRDMRWYDNMLMAQAEAAGWPKAFPSGRTIHMLGYSPSGTLEWHDVFQQAEWWSHTPPLYRSDRWVSLLMSHTTQYGAVLFTGNIGQENATDIRAYSTNYEWVMPVPGNPDRLIISRQANPFGATQWTAETALVRASDGEPVVEGPFPIETHGLWQLHEPTDTLYGTGATILDPADGVVAGGWSSLGGGSYNTSRTRYYGSTGGAIRAFDVADQSTLWTSANQGTLLRWPSGGGVVL